MRNCLLGVVICCLMTGCAWRTQISRGTVSTCKFDFDKKYEVDKVHKIKGSDRAHGIWLIPLGAPDAQEAVQKTIDEANETSERKIVGLANTDVKFRFLWLYFYNQRWYTVEGNPIYEKK